jgi:hypothetical protein
MSVRAYPGTAFALVVAVALFALPARAVVPAPMADPPGVETVRPVALAAKPLKRRASAWRAQAACFHPVRRHIIFLGVGF